MRRRRGSARARPLTGRPRIPKSAEIEWTEIQVAALCDALKSHDGNDRPLEYCEMVGFLFAVACAPELVRPTEWLPAVLGEEWEGFGNPDEVQHVLDLVTALYNRINLQVLERTPALPAGIVLRAEAMRNFGPEAPLGRWASGYADGQSWLEETWNRYRPAKPHEAEAFDLALGRLTIVLAFFGNREFAEAAKRAIKHRGPLEELASRMLEGLPDAMRELAQLGRGLDEARR